MTFFYAVKQEGYMIGTNLHNTVTSSVMCDFTELVRGNDKLLLEQLMPGVRRKNISLDLNSVERIDAGGLSALISLYCEACKAGNTFTVSRPGRHVREILGVVGLDKILVANDAERLSYQHNQLQESAA